MNETVCRVWLSLALRPGGSHAELFDHFGSAEDIWHAGADELKLAGAAPQLIRRLEKRDLAEAARIAGFAERYGINIITFSDPAYPDLLRGIPDPPYLLYVLGNLPGSDDGLTVGIVGTREMTGYGMDCAWRTAYGLASAGAVVVSGMARGIDGVAAAAALKAGGRTVAVLGCGMDTVYPPEHRDLMAAIASSGAVVSEYPPGCPPMARNFPVRNRIISGLSRGVFVVEAGEKSGAVLTAAEAKKQGRDVFALPGRVTDPSSAGTCRLLCEGAKAAAGAADILDYYSGICPGLFDADAFARSICSSEPDEEALSSLGVLLPGERRGKRASRPAEREYKSEPATETREPPSDPRLREFLSLVPDGASVCADSFAGSGYRTEEALNLLSILEISGYLQSVPGGMFRRA